VRASIIGRDERGPATMDVSLTAVLAAVAVHGRHAGKRGGLTVGKRTEFGQQGEDRERGDPADAGYLLQTLALGGERRLRCRS
jgi:hypothetical protein